MVSLGLRNLAQQTDLKMGTSQIVKRGEQRFVISEQMKGDKTYLTEYKVEEFELDPSDGTLPVFDNLQINYTTTDLKENDFFERENQLKWISYTEDESGISFTATHYD